MLPGFRFLFAAIVLSISALIFGLGAAALLRAAHEEVASIPLRRAPPETFFAQPNDTAGSTLAMLRVDTPVAEPQTPDNVPAAALSVEQAAIASMPAEPEKVAALTASTPAEDDSKASAIATPEAAIPDAPVRAEAPAPADAPSPAAEAKIATSEASSPGETAIAAPDSRNTAIGDSPGMAQTKIATLGGPPVIVAPEPPVKKSVAKPERSNIKKRVQARRAKERRRIAVRARIARQAPQAPTDPFAQPIGR